MSGVNPNNPGELLLSQSLTGPPLDTNVSIGSRFTVQPSVDPNFQTPREVPVNTNSSIFPTGVSGRPLSSPIALPPPTLNEALYGPVAPNLLRGQQSLGRGGDGLGSRPVDKLNVITESAVRAVCNTTSMLGAILCDRSIRSSGLSTVGSDGLSITSSGGVSQGCIGSRYGCCENNITFKLNSEGSNCSSRSDFVCSTNVYGCCPGTRIKRANLIGTNCPKGAVPLVGWNFNSTEAEKKAAGFGYKDPIFFGNEQEFVASLPGNPVSDSQLLLEGIQPADDFQFTNLSRSTSPDGSETSDFFRERANIPINGPPQQVNFRFGNNMGV